MNWFTPYYRFVAQEKKIIGIVKNIHFEISNELRNFKNSDLGKEEYSIANLKCISPLLIHQNALTNNFPKIWIEWYNNTGIEKNDSNFLPNTIYPELISFIEKIPLKNSLFNISCSPNLPITVNSYFIIFNRGFPIYKLIAASTFLSNTTTMIKDEKKSIIFSRMFE